MGPQKKQKKKKKLIDGEWYIEMVETWYTVTTCNQTMVKN